MDLKEAETDKMYVAMNISLILSRNLIIINSNKYDLMSIYLYKWTENYDLIVHSFMINSKDRNTIGIIEWLQQKSKI